MTHDEFVILAPKINALTAWQRHQWARTGYKTSELDRCLLLRRPDGGQKRYPTGRSGYRREA